MSLEQSSQSISGPSTTAQSSAPPLRSLRQRTQKIDYNGDIKYKSLDEDVEAAAASSTKGKKSKASAKSRTNQSDVSEDEFNSPSETKSKSKSTEWKPGKRDKRRTEPFEDELKALMSQDPLSPLPLTPIPPGQYHPTPSCQAYPKVLPLPRFAKE
ncbi:hypothetical protein JCM5353_006809 [Sporobolomyces roseus]